MDYKTTYMATLDNNSLVKTYAESNYCQKKERKKKEKKKEKKKSRSRRHKPT